MCNFLMCWLGNKIKYCSQSASVLHIFVRDKHRSFLGWSRRRMSVPVRLWRGSWMWPHRSVSETLPSSLIVLRLRIWLERLRGGGYCVRGWRLDNCWLPHTNNSFFALHSATRHMLKRSIPLHRKRPWTSASLSMSQLLFTQPASMWLHCIHACPLSLFLPLPPSVR